MISSSRVLKEHKAKRGKISIKSKMQISDRDKLSIAYTPGVAKVSEAIAKNKQRVFDYTNRANQVAVITDGSAVLGLGNIGPEAALPVMEGKAVLFKELSDIDAFPLALQTQDSEEIIRTIKLLEPNFAAINLEDISAPRCFEIEDRLKKELSIPVFHDDQHGTAIVVLAGLINAAKILKKDLSKSKVLISGAGAAGLATAKLLYKYGIKDIVVLDSKGAINKKRKDLNKYKKEIAVYNKQNVSGDLQQAIKARDVFIGVSKGGILSPAMVKTMTKDAIVFAMANPTPEIMPSKALAGGAAIVGTGRSDMANQINNALVFPGLFRALLDNGIKQVDDKIKIATSRAIAASVKNPQKNKIVPELLDKQVVKNISLAIKKLKNNL